MELEPITGKNDNAEFVPAENLLLGPMNIKHGQHFIQAGEKDVSKIIKNLVLETKNNLLNDINEIQKQIDSVINSMRGIEVIKEDMWEIIDRFKHNSSVAFAHSISGDFQHPRRMTAGVAVTFKKHFGKPNRNDRLSNFLAYQRDNPKAAAVYSLITKDHFYGKPTVHTYNHAFENLINDFKNRTFSVLVCSPMGCVRDRIEIRHFARKISEFHQVTGAAVLIITEEEPRARRVLHHGLSHEEFIIQLRKEIQKARTEIEVTNPHQPVSQSGFSEIQSYEEDLTSNVSTKFNHPDEPQEANSDNSPNSDFDTLELSSL